MTNGHRVLERVVELAVAALAVPRQDQRVEEHLVAEELGRGVPGQFQHGVAHELVGVRRRGLAAVHRSRNVLHQGAEPGLALPQVALGPDAIADVPEADHDTLDRRVVEQVVRLDLDRDPLAPGVTQTHLEGPGMGPALQELAEGTRRDDAVVGVHEVQRAGAGDGRGVEAQRITPARGEGEPAGPVEQDDRVGRVLDERPVPGLVHVRGPLRLAAREQRGEDPDDGTEHPDGVVVPGPVAPDAVQTDEPAQPSAVQQGDRDDGADALALQLGALRTPLVVELGDAPEVDRVPARQGVAPARHALGRHLLL